MLSMLLVHFNEYLRNVNIVFLHVANSHCPQLEEHVLVCVRVGVYVHVHMCLWKIFTKYYGYYRTQYS